MRCWIISRYVCVCISILVYKDMIRTQYISLYLRAIDWYLMYIILTFRLIFPLYVTAQAAGVVQGALDGGRKH